MVTRAATLDIDLTDYAFYVHGFPHELFTQLRRHSPIFRHPAAEFGSRGRSEEFWVLLSHPLVQQANRDWETFSAHWGPSILRMPEGMEGHTLVSSDPSAHTRLRRLINAGFTPRMVEKLDGRIREYTVRILDSVVERGGEVDFVREVANQLPMLMIAEIMGIPPPDRPRIFDLIDTSFRSGDPQNDLTDDDNLTATIAMYQYAQDLGADKRRESGDDVWSKLALAQIERETGDMESLTVDELDQFFMILSIAGSETTRNAITAGIMALAENPGEFERLRSDSALLDPATEEIIRWASPVTMFARQATRDVELGGTTISTGERITMWYPSANRDENIFNDPFRFDVSRHPNPHVSFGGGGVHFCLGANLAKREVRTMFEEICRRFTNVEITGPPVYCTPGDVIALTADHLPVRMTPR
jgi:cytochrome P450